MMLLSIVEDVFEIEGRGCVIAPGLDQSASPHIRLRNHDSISLHRLMAQPLRHGFMHWSFSMVEPPLVCSDPTTAEHYQKLSSQSARGFGFLLIPAFNAEARNA